MLSCGVTSWTRVRVLGKEERAFLKSVALASASVEITHTHISASLVPRPLPQLSSDAELCGEKAVEWSL